MNITLVAAADVGAYIARDHDGAYYVVTLDDTRDMHCGDVLAGAFDGEGALFYTVRNLTQREDVRICLEYWESPLGPAIDMFLSSISSRPGKILVGQIQFPSDASGLANLLEKAILKTE